MIQAWLLLMELWFLRGSHTIFLCDYLKSLSILERLVEPDSHLITELDFRIYLCLEIGSKPEEAIPYCEKPIAACKSRLQRLTSEAKKLEGPPETPVVSESSYASSTNSQSAESPADIKAEIETLTGLCGDLEKKLEDLQGIMSAKAKANFVPAAESSSEAVIAGLSGSVEPTVSTAHTNAAPTVTHLGVVGRGVRRVVMSPTTESSPAKKRALDNADGSSC